ncbi:hypothetical protein C8F01DRAFT_1119067 [Mycena amicta]|nr:hypothetical protein C8F01DRAFT_1119067 [Mycena amicta]
MSSSSSTPSSSRSSSPEPPTKRKREEHDDPDSDSDSSSDDEDEKITDEPVLSHKQKRLQKRKEKEESKAASKKKRKLPDGSAAAVTNANPKAKRLNSVWVGNLNFKTTPEALTAFFKDAGEVTRVNMPHKAAAGPGMKPENRGYAYVDFASPEAKTIAITLSEQNLLGRKLLIKDGDDFAGRPAAPGEAAVVAATAGGTGLTKSAQRILRAQKQPPAPTLFLGNLPFETTEETIRDLFDAHRKPAKIAAKKPEGEAEAEETKVQKPTAWIRKVRMGTFEDTGLCKGFAFVDFVSTEDATTALVNPRNHHLNGRDLKVEFASADAVRRGQPKERAPDGTPKRHKEPKRVGPRAEKRITREKAGPPSTDDKTVSTKEKAEEREEREEGPAVKKEFKGREGRSERDNKGPKSRPRPGAALALAKRESAAIVPGQGKKIVF